MKKYYILSLSFLILFFPFSVNASFHSDLNTSPSSTNGTGCPASTKSCAVAYEGIRMKVVDKDGQQIGGTRVINLQLNFKESIEWFNNANNYIAFNNGTCSKVDYIKNYNGCDIKNVALGGKNHSILLSSLVLQNQFIRDTEKLHNGIAAVNSFNFGSDSLFKNWDEDDWKNQNGDIDEAEYVWSHFLEPFFGFKQEVWNNLEKDVRMGTYVIIEPTMAIKLDGRVYWGTAYELAQLGYDSTLMDPGYNLRTLLLHRMPCAYYLDGGTIDKATVEGLGIKGIDINSKKYFNTLSYDTNIKSYYGTGTVQSICHNPAGKNSGWMNPEVAAGEYGVGTNLLWLGALNGKEVSCKVIEDDYKSKTGKDLKNSGLYGNTVVYTDGDKKYTYKDYISSCDCDLVDTSYHYYMQTEYRTCMQRYALFGAVDLGGICNKYIIAMNRELKYTDKITIKNLFDSNTINEAIVRYHGGFNPISEWTYDRYAKECLGDNTPPPSTPTDKKGPDCTPKFTGIQKGNPGSCYTGQITYKESGEWEDCIFNDNGHYTTKDDQHNVSKNTANLTYYDNSIGDGSYCKVYCTEELRTSFDAYFPTVEAGRHFTWEGHSISGSRTCKTKTVEYEQFVNDLAAANKKTLNDYVTWQLEIKKQNNINSHSTAKSSSSCSCIYSTAHNDCCTAETSIYVPATCTYEYDCKTTTDKNGKTTRTCKTGKRDCSYYTYPCTKPNNTRYDLYTAAGTSFSASSAGYGTVSKSWGGTSWCSNQATPSTNVSGTRTTYNNDLSWANNIVQKMKSCYNEGNSANWTNNIYNVNPKVNITYSGDAKYGYSGALISEPAYTSVSKELDCVTDYQPLITSCSGQNCTITTQTMKKCKSVKMTQGATVSFELDGNVYRYVNKLTGESFHASQLGNHSDENYINIGQGNLPVSFATNPGDYDGLKLTYSNLGHIKNGQSKIDKIVQSLQKDTGTPYGTFQCGYTVTRGIIEDPNDRGKIVIYRPIDLYDPFPSIDADGRNTGWNWGDRYSTSNKNQTVQRVILNNRNVKGDEVYNLTPMYSFTLTPSLIKSIREHNRNNVYDDENLVCDKNTGGRCISNYLTELIQLTGATGTCTQDRRGTFDTCRY